MPPQMTGRSGFLALTWRVISMDEKIWSPVMLVVPMGDPSQAVVVGSLFQAAHPAPSLNPDVHRIEYSNGTVIEHDRSSGNVSVTTSGDVDVTAAAVNVTASEVTIDAADVFITGQLTVDEDITFRNGHPDKTRLGHLMDQYDLHTHNENNAVGGPTDPPNQSLEGA